jgi:hypothetical protein
MLRRFGWMMSVLALVGCIEYSDNLQLSATGSGSFRMQIAVPSDLDAGLPGDTTQDFFRLDSLRARFSNTPGIHLDSIGVTTADGKQTMTALLRFDSLGALAKIGGEASEDNFLGTVRLYDEGNDKVFERTLNPGPAQQGPEDQMDTLAIGLMNSAMGDGFWTYSLKVPGKILEANTTEKIDSAQGLVSWKFPASEIPRKPVLMKVRYQKMSTGYPWLPWVTMGIGFIVLAAALYALSRKLRRMAQILADRKSSAGSP